MVHHVVEVGRLLDVSGGVVPLVDPALGNRQTPPVLVAVEGVGVNALEHAAINGGAHGGGHFVVGRPDVAQEYRLAVGECCACSSAPHSHPSPLGSIGEETPRHAVGAYLAGNQVLSVSTRRPKVSLSPHLAKLAEEPNISKSSGSGLRRFLL